MESVHYDVLMTSKMKACFQTMKLIPNLAEIDRKAIQQAGIPASTLMEAAGVQMASTVQTHCRPTQRGLIVCGPGNNGGDGFVCARKLYQAGYHALSVIYTGTTYKNEALANLEQILIGCPIQVTNAREQTELALSQIEQADFIVDALFGSGLSRPITDIEAQLVDSMNKARQKTYPAWILAVDLPSGIDGATGQVLGCAVEADATVTLAASKPGLYLHPGKAHAGTVSIVEIGIPTRLIYEDDSPIRLITLDNARTWLPHRKPDSHKYSHGQVLVIAGSKRMPGAAILCSEAAMSSGAGLVTLAAPASVFEQLPLMPEIIRLPLPDAEVLGVASIPIIQEALASGKYNTVVIGPGLGQAIETADAIRQLLAHFKSLKFPVVVDADGLNALSQEPLTLNPQFIITPHIGECGRLVQQDNSSILADVLQAAQHTRERYQAQIVLKSASTVIATLENNKPEQSLCWISPTGNPGMATAGSGDVLTGIIGAMAAQCTAQGYPAWQAALLGVFLHGLAGDAAAAELTPYAMHASAITRYLPQAFKAILTP